jgi:DnaJ-class molecular chaperone
MSAELRDVQRIGPPTLTEAVKVRYERCFVCGGDGWVETRISADGIGVGHECRYCNGKGSIAVEVPA